MALSQGSGLEDGMGKPSTHPYKNADLSFQMVELPLLDDAFTWQITVKQIWGTSYYMTIKKKIGDIGGQLHHLEAPIYKQISSHLEAKAKAKP